MNDYRQVEDRDTNHSNCTRCGIIVEFAYITTGESLCSDCYCKTIENQNILFYKELSKETIHSSIGDGTNETK